MKGFLQVGTAVIAIGGATPAFAQQGVITEYYPETGVVEYTPVE